MDGGAAAEEPAGGDRAPASAAPAPPSSPGRRRLLVGGVAVVAAGIGAVAAVDAGLLPGRTRLRTALGQEGPDGTVPDVDPGPSTTGSFRSEARQARTGWSISYPPGTTPGDPLPVLVALHGKYGNHRSATQELGMDRYLAAAVGAGMAPFAIAAVDGGNTYWHRRRDGSDSGAMVVDELVPLLRSKGLDTSRLGLFGWSMGGYGTLLLAAREGRDLGLRCASTLSAAIWDRFDETAPGAFDGPADFSRNDLFAVRAPRGLPRRMDCGADDPFAAANRAYRLRVAPAPSGGTQPGVHTVGYWRRMVPAHLRFAAAHLAG